MADKLGEYKKKRDFNKTAEPQGGSARKSAEKRRRFCVQHHLASRDHYDFRLEWDGVLLSWAVPKGPSLDPDDKRLAIHVEDHPLDYGSFEGTIPQGQYGGGTVMLWDEGTYAPVYDFREGLAKGSLKFELFGERLGGIWNLVRSARQDERQEMWFLIKHNDAFARGEAGIDGFTTSVTTGRTMDEIASGAKPRRVKKSAAAAKAGAVGKTVTAKNPFDRAPVQVAELVEQPPAGDDWLFEVKYDGIRALAFAGGGKVRLLSRNDNDLSPRFAGVARAVGELLGGRAAVLDGELALADEEGRTSFQKLQRHMRGESGEPCYMVFDLLALDGEDLRGLPLVRRKELLHALLKGAAESGTVRLSGHVVGRGRESFAAAQKMGLEGVIGKRAQSAYGEKGAWVKVKCVKRQEFVVGGWAASEGREMSSLLLGFYAGEQLIPCGRVGTGFSEKDRTEIAKKLARIAVKKCPFESEPKAKSGERLFWARPVTIAEVVFAEWTSDGALRHASFQGFRTDKDARDVVREDAEKPRRQPTKRGAAAKELAAFATDVAIAPSEREKKPSRANNSRSNGTEREIAIPRMPERRSAEESDVVCGVKITHPEREAGAGTGVTKLDAAKYYERAAARMLPYVGGRILSVVRCHGDGKPCFFKKHPSGEKAGVVAVDVGGDEEYFYVDRAEGLIAEVQAGTVEFHMWGSRADDTDRPDTMVFDLDPDAGTDLERVRQGVRDLKSVLDELSLTSFLKTSGGKGYHVVVPFAPSAGWDEFKEFARGVAEVMAARWPGLYTANSRIAARKGKIYIDFLRNGKGATSVAPYSLRARAGGGVSVPIGWDELDSVAPDGIDIAGALARLDAPDPWQGYFRVRQSLGGKARGGRR